jgi:hypothetical protein
MSTVECRLTRQGIRALPEDLPEKRLLPRRLTLCLLSCLFLFAAPSAQAHPVSQGSMEIVLAPGGVKVTAVVAREEVLVASAFGAEKDDSPADKVRHHAEYLLAHVRIRVDGRLLEGRVVATRCELSGRPEYELEYGPIEGTPHRVSVEQDVLREIEFAPGNQWEATYLTRVHLGGQSGTQRFLLTYKSPLDIDCVSMNKAGGSYQETAAFAAAFVRHGIAHILTGYDHLLFVAALLLAVTTLWDLVKVISAFTLAHTITLALAALDVFRLPGRIVEPMIAASIMFVALQNIFWPERSRGWSRLAVAFGFGLFHGLGFAGGLLGAMSGARAGGAALAILAFGLGVEIGHQVVVLPLFGALRLLRASNGRKPWHHPFVQRYGSAGISFAGAIYFVAALR